MGIKQTNQIEIRFFGSDGTDQNMSFVQTKQTGDRKTGIKQTKT